MAQFAASRFEHVAFSVATPTVLSALFDEMWTAQEAVSGRHAITCHVSVSWAEKGALCSRP